MICTAMLERQLVLAGRYVDGAAAALVLEACSGLAVAVAGAAGAEEPPLDAEGASPLAAVVVLAG